MAAIPEKSLDTHQLKKLGQAYNQQAEPQVRFELDDVSLVLQRVNWGNDVYKEHSFTDFHKHALLQIEYIYSGVFMLEAENRAGRFLSEGMFALIPPGIVHRWRCVSEGAMIGVELMIEGEGRSAFVDYFAERCGCDLIFHSADETIHRTVREMAASALQPQLWSGQLCSSLLMQWVARMLLKLEGIEQFKSRVEAGPPYRTHMNDICAVAADYMHDNYMRNIKAADIAFHCGVSQGHLNRLFHTLYKESMINRLIGIRLEKALQMLQQKPKPHVKEVYLSCGFKSNEHFTRSFKKRYGFVPKEV